MTTNFELRVSFETVCGGPFPWRTGCWDCLMKRLDAHDDYRWHLVIRTPIYSLPELMSTFRGHWTLVTCPLSGLPGRNWVGGSYLAILECVALSHDGLSSLWKHRFTIHPSFGRLMGFIFVELSGHIVFICLKECLWLNKGDKKTKSKKWSVWMDSTQLSTLAAFQW